MLLLFRVRSSLSRSTISDINWFPAITHSACVGYAAVICMTHYRTPGIGQSLVRGVSYIFLQWLTLCLKMWLTTVGNWPTKYLKSDVPVLENDCPNDTPKAMQDLWWGDKVSPVISLISEYGRRSDKWIWQKVGCFQCIGVYTTLMYNRFRLSTYRRTNVKWLTLTHLLLYNVTDNWCIWLYLASTIFGKWVKWLNNDAPLPGVR